MRFNNMPTWKDLIEFFISVIRWLGSVRIGVAIMALGICMILVGFGIGSAFFVILGGLLVLLISRSLD